jgi:hypothetical protein
MFDQLRGYVPTAEKMKNNVFNHPSVALTRVASSPGMPFSAKHSMVPGDRVADNGDRACRETPIRIDKKERSTWHF